MHMHVAYVIPKQTFINGVRSRYRPALVSFAVDEWRYQHGSGLGSMEQKRIKPLIHISISSPPNPFLPSDDSWNIGPLHSFSTSLYPQPTRTTRTQHIQNNQNVRDIIDRVYAPRNGRECGSDRAVLPLAVRLHAQSLDRVPEAGRRGQE